MGVAGEIGQHGLGSCEGLFGIDDPVDLPERPQVLGKPGGIFEDLMLAEELELAIVIGLVQCFEEAVAEPGA